MPNFEPARITSSRDRKQEPEHRSLPPSEILEDRKMEIRGKTFFLDLIKNGYGVALRVSEATAQKRSRIVIPAEHFEAFAGCMMELMTASTVEKKALADGE